MNHNNSDYEYTIHLFTEVPPPSPTRTRVSKRHIPSDTFATVSVSEMRNDDFTMVNYGSHTNIKTWFNVELVVGNANVDL